MTTPIQRRGFLRMVGAGSMAPLVPPVTERLWSCHAA
jgi:hypothetical protein